MRAAPVEETYCASEVHNSTEAGRGSMMVDSEEGSTAVIKFRDVGGSKRPVDDRCLVAYSLQLYREKAVWVYPARFNEAIVDKNTFVTGRASPILYLASWTLTSRERTAVSNSFIPF